MSSLVPGLSPLNPQVADLLKRNRGRPTKLLYTPKYKPKSTDYVSTHAAVDARFSNAVVKEPKPERGWLNRPKLGRVQQGFVSMRRGWLNKPAGNPEHPLMVILHYPTFKAWRRAYQTLHDPTSEVIHDVFMNFWTKPGPRRSDRVAHIPPGRLSSFSDGQPRNANTCRH